MFDIDPSELLLVTAVAFVVLGPKRLPSALEQIGKWLGSARRGATALLRQLERETGFKRVVEHARPKLRIVWRRPQASAPEDGR